MKPITKNRYKVTFNPDSKRPTYSIISGRVIRLLLKDIGFTNYEVDGGMDFSDVKSMNIKLIDNDKVYKCGCGSEHEKFKIPRHYQGSEEVKID